MRTKRVLASQAFRLLLAILCLAQFALASDRWQGTWASAQMIAAPSDLPDLVFHEVTVRQNIRISCGGNKLRVRISNEFGDGLLDIGAATIALTGKASSIRKASEKALKFAGQKRISIAAGTAVTSDSLTFAAPALSRLTITLYIKSAPKQITAHPGSRTTSYLLAGNSVHSAELPTAVKIDRWYFLSAVEVSASHNAGAIAILGDSITDGRGSTTNGNDRWPDRLAERLAADPKTAGIGVLNLGIGGNRLLLDGTGPRALDRLQRDIFAQSNVRWLIVLEGVNDLGTRPKEKGAADAGATAADILSAYQQIIREAHSHNIRVYGATILPFDGAAYATSENVADQQKINDWMRTSRAYDAVIDFAKLLADPSHPDRLLPAFDTGDHLHPSAPGYKAMGDAIPLSLFNP
ncbi:lipolytic enzyme, G-D-S-L [Candidatus Koribacter versatilis Ellin345]|uniref:Lipolytic enzyme, G-D-S-L n=1 Tax=Koribacter versatilis (strain Ellin345) TaxID=204669 RepID=Q1IT33_KORVE|nr:SGNH/GDSL hydrolase family protein [Candidatus Koribacter versatilis]ABF39967.1 lipolytic enzyme, G-D-S-L [Candidatus Koribacter versatilis Ellin345]